jgi:hypothetical protein
MPKQELLPLPGLPILCRGCGVKVTHAIAQYVGYRRWLLCRCGTFLPEQREV